MMPAWLQVINLASNNYLGLATHPKLRAATVEALRKYGVGSVPVRRRAGRVAGRGALAGRVRNLF